MERQTILSYEQFRRLARPTSTHLDEEEVNVFIRECEDEHIIPILGWSNYKAAVNMTNSWDNTFDDTFEPSIFIDGGEWDETYVDASGLMATRQRYTNSIRKAIAYYVYAKLLRTDGTIISRSGAMRHRSEESDHVDDSKLKQYNDAISLAEMYLNDSLSYLEAHRLKPARKIRGTRARIHAIGK